MSVPRRGLPDDKKASKKKPPKTARKKKLKVPGFLKAAIVVGGLGLLGYWYAQTAGVAYGEKELGMIDFSSLTEPQKLTALREANGIRCSCGCGLTLAECIATDSTCPIREPNIQTVKGMVEKAKRP